MNSRWTDSGRLAIDQEDSMVDQSQGVLRLDAERRDYLLQQGKSACPLCKGPNRY